MTLEGKSTRSSIPHVRQSFRPMSEMWTSGNRGTGRLNATDNKAFLLLRKVPHHGGYKDLWKKVPGLSWRPIQAVQLMQAGLGDSAGGVVRKASELCLPWQGSRPSNNKQSPFPQLQCDWPYPGTPHHQVSRPPSEAQHSQSRPVPFGPRTPMSMC